MKRTHRIPFLILLALFLLPVLGWAQLAPFVIISDSHVGARDSLYLAVIKRIDEERIRVIIHTGDAIDSPGNQKQWATFFEITGPDKILHHTAGNHDILGQRSLETYLTFFPNPYYSVSDKDTLFLFLNTELPGEEGSVTGQQLAWLTAELDKPYRFKFVFLHEPLYPFVPGHGLDRFEEARDHLHRLFVEKGVSFVASGHDHVYHRTEKDGIVYVISAAARKRHRVFLKNGEVRYMVAIRKNDGYAFTVKNLRGITRDEFSVSGLSFERPQEIKRELMRQ
ncbi:MAG: Calcineurin-like phosphoesterase [Syntrophorhabdaceae bacterium PtaU1.Bin034]|nr:MAG: Calcineurin-like phosphoesterase [Syntrophorhabdaceae bacterium PtaU1.Bin034]